MSAAYRIWEGWAVEHITHDVTEMWHVFAGGEWLATEYGGYAPVNVWVGERLVPVERRHVASSVSAVCGVCNK